MRKYIIILIFFEEVNGMAYVINEECVACGACEPECPEGCISESGGTYVIDAAKCTDCGACADVCPVEAPVKG